MKPLRTLKALRHFHARPRGEDLATRLDSYYAPQAELFDESRESMAPGRHELFQALAPPPGAICVDLGGATGSNWEHLGVPVRQLGRVYIVDLAESLLRVARTRVQARGWDNVETVRHDAASFRPREGRADLVTLSYTLSMMPNWRDVLDSVAEMLAPGGTVAVADVYLSPANPPPGFRRHGWIPRMFWPKYFSRIGAVPSLEHVLVLHDLFEPTSFREDFIKGPLLPLIELPYYVFIGRKRR